MRDSLAPNLSRLRRIAIYARIGTVMLLIAMFVGTHLPPRTLVNAPDISDKLVHFLAYMMLSISALASWELSIGELRPSHYFTVWLCGTLYGAFDEVTQIPIGRSCNGLDWIADIAGIVVGLTIFRLARPLMYRFL